MSIRTPNFRPSHPKQKVLILPVPSYGWLTSPYQIGDKDFLAWKLTYPPMIAAAEMRPFCGNADRDAAIEAALEQFRTESSEKWGHHGGTSLHDASEVMVVEVSELFYVQGGNCAEIVVEVGGYETVELPAPTKAAKSRR